MTVHGIERDSVAMQAPLPLQDKVTRPARYLRSRPIAALAFVS